MLSVLDVPAFPPKREMPSCSRAGTQWGIVSKLQDGVASRCVSKRFRPNPSTTSGIRATVAASFSWSVSRRPKIDATRVMEGEIALERGARSRAQKVPAGRRLGILILVLLFIALRDLLLIT